MKLSCVIIDDEPLAVRLLVSYAEKTPFLNLVATYSNAIDALSALTNNPVDILFLDIQMPELSGMELSRMLPKSTRVVFTTAFSQYAVESYLVDAANYLLKPIDYTHFLQAANKVLQAQQQTPPTQPIQRTLQEESTSPNSIIVKTEYKLRQIELADILYIEGLKDYVKIFIQDEIHPVLTLMKMSDLENTLPLDRFIRVHRSFIVQLNKIGFIDRNRIVFGKTYIPISNGYRKSFDAFISKHALLIK